MNDILWTSAAPLWAEQNGSDLGGLSRPTILRFAKDSFMDEFSGLLENQPARLADYRAWPETWRDPLPAPTAAPALPPALRQIQRKRLGSGLGVATRLELADFSDAARPLKLYQPAHQRYYLVTASLVCQQVGLPDRAIETSAQEKASFVLRRLMLATPGDFTAQNPPDPDQAQLGVYDEYAFVDGEWQKVAEGKSLVAGEELNPLFAVCYPQGDGRRRRLFGGLIPVGKREVYMSAKKTVETVAGNGTMIVAAPSAVSVSDPRLDMLLRRVFFEPWDSLIGSANHTVTKMNTDRLKMRITDHDHLGELKGTQAADVLRMRRQVQETSWYLLLDLADFLDQHMKPALDALKNNSVPSETSARSVVDALNNVILPDAMRTAIQNATGVYHLPHMTVADSLGNALSRIQAYKEEQLRMANQPYLETASEPYKGSDGDSSAGWPNFLFPLVDLEIENTASDWQVMLNFPHKIPAGSTDPGPLLDELRTTLLTALPAQGPVRLPPVPLAAQISKTMDESITSTETGWFIVRCVLERPNCLPLPQALWSNPTVAFQLAGFFDPDAPARPIRIALPVDTSPAGLRKFDKNTAFIMSDILCGQVERAKSLGLIDLVLSALPWPFHKDLDMTSTPCVDGTICSLSIPIITICALILLMIFVSLLDIIFHWLPFLMICFPLKKFNAKAANL